MPVLFLSLRMSLIVVLSCGVLVGVSGVNEPAWSDTDSVSTTRTGTARRDARVTPRSRKSA